VRGIIELCIISLTSAHRIISTALTAMLRELDFAIMPALTAMSRAPWQSQEFVSTESVYMNDLVTSINGVVGSIKGHVEHRKYIRSLADRVATLILAKLTATLVRARPISQIGAEQVRDFRQLLSLKLKRSFAQILLDLQTLKRCLNRLPATAGEDTIPAT
jgi:hypothetical protein